MVVNLDTGDSYGLRCKVSESESVSKAEHFDSVDREVGQEDPPFVPLRMVYVSEEALNKSGRYTLKASFTDLTQG